MWKSDRHLKIKALIALELCTFLEDLFNSEFKIKYHTFCKFSFFFPLGIFTQSLSNFLISLSFHSPDLASTVCSLERERREEPSLHLLRFHHPIALHLLVLHYGPSFSLGSQSITICHMPVCKPCTIFVFVQLSSYIFNLV